MQYDSLGELTIWGRRRSDTRASLLTSQAYTSCPPWSWAAPWSGSGFLFDLVKSLSKSRGSAHFEGHPENLYIPIARWQLKCPPIHSLLQWQLKRSHYWGWGWGDLSRSYSGYLVLRNTLLGNHLVWNPICFLKSEGKCNHFKLLFFIFSCHSGNLKYIFNNLLKKKTI